MQAGPRFRDFQRHPGHYLNSATAVNTLENAERVGANGYGDRTGTEYYSTGFGTSQFPLWVLGIDGPLYIHTSYSNWSLGLRWKLEPPRLASGE